jgi:hypothetical protein
VFQNKKLRPWPVFLLLFLILVSTINLVSGKRRKGNLIDISNQSSVAEKCGFTSLHTSITSVEKVLKDSNTSTFIITPDLVSLKMCCTGSFRKIKGDDFRLSLVWYKENSIMFAETLWLGPTDTSFNSYCNIHRQDTGNWSIDLMYKNNLLLETQSFTVNMGRGVK